MRGRGEGFFSVIRNSGMRGAPKTALEAACGQMCIILLKIICLFDFSLGLVAIFGKNMVVL